MGLPLSVTSLIVPATGIMTFAMEPTGMDTLCAKPDGLSRDHELKTSPLEPNAARCPFAHVRVPASMPARTVSA
jgi:hypothetical protein